MPLFFRPITCLALWTHAPILFSDVGRWFPRGRKVLHEFVIHRDSLQENALNTDGVILGLGWNRSLDQHDHRYCLVHRRIWMGHLVRLARLKAVGLAGLAWLMLPEKVDQALIAR